MSLLPVDQAAALIAEGRPLLLAGDAAALSALPRGSWVGGTSPYFMTACGGREDRQSVFVQQLPPGVGLSSIRTYAASEVHRVFQDASPRGLSAIVLPAFSSVHERFAREAPSFPSFALSPLFGWIAGVHLDEVGRVAPLVFDGASGRAADDLAVVMEIGLPPGTYATVHQINPFGADGFAQLEFLEDGFVAREVVVDGVRQSFAVFLRERAVDVRCPLVGDYCGASVNVSFRAIDEETGDVHLYAPVFRGVSYRLASPLADYAQAFAALITRVAPDRVLASCNCILNYVHGELEGRATPPFEGPITFGEVAFQLVNQTLVYVTLDRE